MALWHAMRATIICIVQLRRAHATGLARRSGLGGDVIEVSRQLVDQISEDPEPQLAKCFWAWVSKWLMRVTCSEKCVLSVKRD